jgi:DNA repair protein RadC
MPRLKKGSAAAKAFMAKIRAAKGKPGRKAKLKVYAKENTSGKVSIYARSAKKKSKKVGSLSNYDKAPMAVKRIIDNLDEGGNYTELMAAKKSLKNLGYDFDFDLNGQVTKLKKRTSGKKVGAAQIVKINYPKTFAVGFRKNPNNLTEIEANNITQAIKIFQDRLKPIYGKVPRTWLIAKQLSEITITRKAKPKAKIPATKKMSGYDIPKERIFISGSITHKKKLCGIGKTDDKTSYNVPPIKVLIQKREISKLPKITSSSVAAQICREAINKTGLMQTQEVFGVLILNNQNQVLGVYNHTIGTQVSTQIDVTLIAAMIAKLAPKAAIIFHNHPSGNLIPSDADLVMTRQLKEALKILACQLLDSLIITDLGYYSLADEGKL